MFRNTTSTTNSVNKTQRDEDSSETETSTVETTTESNEPIITQIVEEKVNIEDETKESSDDELQEERPLEKKELKKVVKTKAPLKEEKKEIRNIEKNLGTTRSPVIRGGGKITTNQIICNKKEEDTKTIIGNEIPYEYTIKYETNEEQGTKIKNVIIGKEKSLLKIELLDQVVPFGDVKPDFELRNVEFINNADYDCSTKSFNAENEQDAKFRIADCFMQNQEMFSEEGWTVRYLVENPEGDIVIDGTHYSVLENTSAITRNVIQFNDGAMLKNSNLNACKDNNVHIITGGKFSDGSQDTLNSNVDSNQAVEFGDSNSSGISHISTLKISDYDVSSVTESNVESTVKEELTRGLKYDNKELYDPTDFQQYVIELVAKYNDYDILVKVDEETYERLLDYVIAHPEEKYDDAFIEKITVSEKTHVGEEKDYPTYALMKEEVSETITVDGQSVNKVLPLRDVVKQRIKDIETRVNTEYDEENHNGDNKITLQESVAHSMCETPLQIKEIMYNDPNTPSDHGKKKKIPLRRGDKISDVIDFLNSENTIEPAPGDIKEVELYELQHKEINSDSTKVLTALQSTQEYIRRSKVPTDSDVDIQNKPEWMNNEYCYPYGRQDTFFRARFYQELLMNGLPLYQVNEEAVYNENEAHGNKPVEKREIEKKGRKGFRGEKAPNRKLNSALEWKFGALTNEENGKMKEREVYLQDTGIIGQEAEKNFIVKTLIVDELIERGTGQAERVSVSALRSLMSGIWNEKNEIAEGAIVNKLQTHWLEDLKFKRVIEGVESEVEEKGYLLDVLYEYFHGYNDVMITYTISESEDTIKNHTYGQLDETKFIDELKKSMYVCTLMSTWIDIMTSKGRLVRSVVLKGSSVEVPFTQYLNEKMGSEVVRIIFEESVVPGTNPDEIREYINDKINSGDIVTWEDLYNFIESLDYDDDVYLFCPYPVYYDEGESSLLQVPLALKCSDLKDWFHKTFYEQLTNDNETGKRLDEETKMGKKLYKDKESDEWVLIDQIKLIRISGTSDDELSASLSDLTCAPFKIDNFLNFEGHFMVPIDKQRYTRMIYELINSKFDEYATITITFVRYNQEAFKKDFTISFTKSDLKGYAESEPEDDSANSIIGIINEIASEGVDGYIPISINDNYYYECVLTEIKVETNGTTITLLHDDLNPYVEENEAIEDAKDVRTFDEADEQIEWLKECGMKAAQSSWTMLYTVKADDKSGWYEYAPLEWYYDYTYVEQGKTNGYWKILEAISHDKENKNEPDKFGVSYKYVDEFREIMEYVGYKSVRSTKRVNKVGSTALNVKPKSVNRVIGGHGKSRITCALNSKPLISTFVRPMKGEKQMNVGKKELGKNDFKVKSNKKSEMINSFEKKNDVRKNIRTNIRKIRGSGPIDLDASTMICGFRHYEYRLMIEYLQHIISMQPATTQFIVKFDDIKTGEETTGVDYLTVNLILELLIRDYEEGTVYSTFLKSTLRPKDSVYSYCTNPIVSSSNALPDFALDENSAVDTTDDALLRCYNFYREYFDMFESGLKDKYVVKDSYSMILGETEYDTIWYDSNGEMLTQYDEVSVKNQGTVEEELDLSEPRELHFLRGTTPENNETFEEYVGRVFSVVDQIGEGKIPEPKIRVVPGSTVGFHYLNQWIMKQLVDKGVLIPKTKKRDDNKEVPVHYIVECTPKDNTDRQILTYPYDQFLTIVGIMQNTMSFELKWTLESIAEDYDVDFFSTMQEAKSDLYANLKVFSTPVNDNYEVSKLNEYLHEWQYRCSKLNASGSSTDVFDVSKSFKIKIGDKVILIQDLLNDNARISELTGIETSNIEMIEYSIKDPEDVPQEDGVVIEGKFYENWNEAVEDIIAYFHLVSNGSSDEQRSIKEFMHDWQYLCSKLNVEGTRNGDLFQEGCTLLISIGEDEWYLDDLLKLTELPASFKTMKKEDIERIGYEIKRVEAPVNPNENMDGITLIEGEEEFTQWYSDCEIISYDNKTIRRYALNSQTDMQEILKYYNRLTGNDQWVIKNHNPKDDAIVMNENWDCHDMKYDETKKDNGKNSDETLDFMQQFEAERNKCQVFNKDTTDDTGKGNVMFLLCISSSTGTIITELFTEGYDPKRKLDAFMVHDYDENTVTQLVCKSIIENTIDYEKLESEVLSNSLYEQDLSTVQIVTSSPFLDQLKGELKKGNEDLVDEKDIQLGYLILKRRLESDSTTTLPSQRNKK